MHEDPKGQAILKELMIDKFIAPQDKWYDSIRKINLELAALEN
jgi:phosphonate transport system substrate-binding protein